MDSAVANCTELRPMEKLMETNERAASGHVLVKSLRAYIDFHLAGTPHTGSIQLSFIYIVPNYNKCHLKALK